MLVKLAAVLVKLVLLPIKVAAKELVLVQSAFIILLIHKKLDLLSVLLGLG